MNSSGKIYFEEEREARHSDGAPKHNTQQSQVGRSRVPNHLKDLASKIKQTNMYILFKGKGGEPTKLSSFLSVDEVERAGRG